MKQVKVCPVLGTALPQLVLVVVIFVDVDNVVGHLATSSTLLEHVYSINLSLFVIYAILILLVGMFYMNMVLLKKKKSKGACKYYISRFSRILDPPP